MFVPEFKYQILQSQINEITLKLPYTPTPFCNFYTQLNCLNQLRIYLDYIQTGFQSEKY